MGIIRINSISNYAGKFSEMPNELPFGDTYFATDTKKKYIYGQDNKPIIEAGLKKMIISINQIGTDAPVLELLFNDSSLDLSNISAVRSGSGLYSILYSTTDQTLFDKLFLDINPTSNNILTTVSKSDQIGKESNIAFTIFTLNVSSNLGSDGKLVDSLFTINVNE